MADKVKQGKFFITFLSCVLAMPTCTYILPGIQSEELMPAVSAGVILGLAYLMLRPIMRILTLPIGCLTLGLFNLALDVGLICLSASLIEGFTVTGWIPALFAAILVNAVVAIVGGFR